MIKCELNMCKNNKQGLCNEEISIKKSYDNEMGYFIGGKCCNYKPKQSYLDEESKRTFRLMKISKDTYYAVRKDVYDDVDVKYILKKHPNMKTLITDNILMMGSSKANHRFWLYEISDGEIKLASGCDKYNELITDDMLRFTCDYIREIPNHFNTVGCLTSTVYKMIMKGFNL